MGVVQQTLTIGRLMSLPSTGRYGSLVVVIVSTALVVGILASLMSVLSGYQQAVQNTGTEGVFLVLSEGANSETGSELVADQALILDSAPGLMERDGIRVMSKELLRAVSLYSKGTGERANITFRGVMMPAAAFLSDSFQIVEGRMLESGLFEVIVGRRASQEFENLELNGEFVVRGVALRVVGLFEDGGSIAESEIWIDVTPFRSVFMRMPARRRDFTLARVRLSEDEDSEARFLEFLESDDRLTLTAHRETTYYSERLPGFLRIIETIGYPLLALMSLGAIIALLNSFYSALIERKRHYAVLRALGFGALPISASMIVEALSLALVGGLLATAMVYSLLNGREISVMGAGTGAQTIFDTALTWQVLIIAVAVACAIGILGGLLPAIGAARRSVTRVLQDR